MAAQAERRRDPQPNDHADEAYDRAILDRLESLHADAGAWLAPVESQSSRLSGYRERLSRAIERAREPVLAHRRPCVGVTALELGR